MLAFGKRNAKTFLGRSSKLDNSHTKLMSHLSSERDDSQESWTGDKPNIEHLRVFGCVGFAHVPSQKRVKLDDRGKKCIFLGISEGSKAYKMYDPTTNQVIVSRDVIFDEE